MKMNQEVDQPQEKIKTVGERQAQAIEEKQRELEERMGLKSNTNYVRKEDMKKNVTEKIKTRLQEK